MDNKANPRTREYACGVCGLVYWGYWSAEYGREPCKDCGNRNVYACDTFGWAMSSGDVLKSLRRRNMRFHSREGLFPEWCRKTYEVQGLLGFWRCHLSRIRRFPVWLWQHWIYFPFRIMLFRLDFWREHLRQR